MKTWNIFIATALTLHASSNAFTIRPTLPRLIQSTNSRPSTRLHLFENDEDDTIIPPELRSEIYAAESRTETAQSRPQRVLSNGLLTFVGVSIAFFNAFLTSLRFGEGAPSSDLSYYGFGWVEANWFWSFLFMNKLGGGLGLLSAGLFGTLAEVELRSRKENAEKIWQEMQRRKASREEAGIKKSKKKNNAIPQSSKKSMSGKQKKRRMALEELMEDNVTVDSSTVQEESQATENQQPQEEVKPKEGGILGTIKNFYEKADSMAASQALLLNKELEDRGVIEKITDESGLRVIGKEAAAKEKAKAEEGVKGGDGK